MGEVAAAIIGAVIAAGAGAANANAGQVKAGRRNREQKALSGKLRAQKPQTGDRCRKRRDRREGATG